MSADSTQIQHRSELPRTKDSSAEPKKTKNTSAEPKKKPKTHRLNQKTYG
jgi:hypothetical protein